MKEMMIEYFFFRICDDILTVFDALILVQSGLGIVTVLVIVKPTYVIKVIACLSNFYQHRSSEQVIMFCLYQQKKDFI